MTTTTKPAPDPDTIRDKARRLAEQAAKAQAEVEAVEAAARARLVERQAAHDREVVAAYRPIEHDDAVLTAHQELLAVVTDHPLTQALARYLAAQSLRQHAHSEYIGARARLGMSTGPTQQPPTTGGLPVGEYVNTAAERLAHEVLERAISDADRRRSHDDTDDTDDTKETR